MATNDAINAGLSGVTGTGNFVGSTSPTLITPTLGVATATSLKFSGNNGILDSNGNEMLALSPTASSVNYFTITNAATLGNPSLSAAGSDTNINAILKGKGSGAAVLADGNGNTVLGAIGVSTPINWIYVSNAASGNAPSIQSVNEGFSGNVSLIVEGQGTGCVNIKGTGTNDAAASGYVGEYISAQVASGSAASIANNTIVNVTSISLTAGDWNVTGNVGFSTGGVFSGLAAATGTSSASLGDLSIISILGSTGVIGTTSLPIFTQRFSFSSTTTVYLCARANYSAGSPTVCGFIGARRIR